LASAITLGKLFEKELQKFDLTYSFSIDLEIVDFKTSINSTGFPLISVGSGGSLTSALFVSLLHQQTNNISIYLTPLEICSLNQFGLKSSVIFITAGGKNYDILSAFKNIAEKEPVSLNAICATKDSPLKRLTENYLYSNLLEFNLPCGKDGFLATNSLLSFNLLLLRLYENTTGNIYQIPDSLDSLVHPGFSREDFLKSFGGQFTSSFLKRDTFVILFGRWGKPAAFDLESKFTEAALGNTQISDYRNFAHGRHNWLAKRGNQTGIIAFLTPEDEKFAEKTLSLVPKEIPIVRISSEKKSEQVAALDLIVKGMFAVNIVGKSRNINPGRPSVPEFGVKIYHLHFPIGPEPGMQFNLPNKEYAPLLRKLKSLKELTNDREVVELWKQAYSNFKTNLLNARFGSVVLDYDGTVCEFENRYQGICPRIGVLLSNLLANGAAIGIATGRGKSVRFDLQKTIPQSYWQNVLIGYYSGSDIGFLSDDTRPNKSAETDPELVNLIRHIDNPKLFGINGIEIRPKQISFEPIDNFPFHVLVEFLRSIAEQLNLHDLQILESGHSVDALARNVSKVALVKEVENIQATRGLVANCLCIGDRGKWPGNDFSLLSGPYSLSVDTVSSNLNSCWNLAPLGHRGVQATEDYLKSLEFVEKGLMLFNYNKLQVT